jgi:hypothetical protein
VVRHQGSRDLRSHCVFLPNDKNRGSHDRGPRVRIHFPPRRVSCEPVFFGMPKRRKTTAPAVAPFSAVLSSTARTISSGVRLILFLVSVVVTFVFPSRPAPGLAPVMGRIVSRFEGHGSAPNPLERGAARSWLGPGRSGRPEALQSA